MFEIKATAMFQSSVLLFFFNIKNSSITTSYGELFIVKFSHVFYAIGLLSILFSFNQSSSLKINVIML